MEKLLDAYDAILPTLVWRRVPAPSFPGAGATTCAEVYEGRTDGWIVNLIAYPSRGSTAIEGAACCRGVVLRLSARDQAGRSLKYARLTCCPQEEPPNG